MSKDSRLDTYPDTCLAPGVAEGEEFAWVREMYATDRATKALGISITALDHGLAEGHFSVTEDMCQGHMTAHGGFLFAFADSLFAGACNSGGSPAVAAQVSIHYIAPAKAGDVVHGRAVTRQEWGRNGITDVELRVDGKVIAEFRGTSRVVGPPAK